MLHALRTLLSLLAVPALSAAAAPLVVWLQSVVGNVGVCEVRLYHDNTGRN